MEASGDIILASYPNLVRIDSSAILTPISSSGLPFYSLLPEQVSQPAQQRRLISRSPIASPYALDEARQKTKKEQYEGAPIIAKAEEKKQPQQLLSNSKVAILIVVIAISLIVAFIFISGIHTQAPNHLPSVIDQSIITKSLCEKSTSSIGDPCTCKM